MIKTIIGITANIICSPIIILGMSLALAKIMFCKGADIVYDLYDEDWI